MLNSQSLTKIALITGAAGSIGHALASEFIAGGYMVIAMDIANKPKTLDCHHYIQSDLSRYVTEELYAKEINLMIEALCDGRLDALINNAAIQLTKPVESLNREDWQHTLNINLLAPFLLTQALLRALEKAEGTVINISSIHARLTKPQFVAYATSKAALSALTRSLCMELGRRKIRTNALEPAAIESEMLKAGFGDSVDMYTALNNYHPIGRIGTPLEVAKAAVWLCSDGCRFIDGACLGVDGGISSKLSDPMT